MNNTSASELHELGYKYQKGINVDKDEKKAFEFYLKSANMGDSTAMNDVGICYEDGSGVEKDEHKAFIYYQKSADLGHAQGTFNVGYCYRNGIGVEKNENNAFIYYQKSADVDNVNGIYMVGYCYEKGTGVEKDQNKAFIYYQKSADMGLAIGIYALGNCYKDGIGVEKDDHKAFYYYKKSSDLGHSKGTFNLGYCYQNGIGVEKDEHKTFIYYQKSADMGDADGAYNVGYCCYYGIGVENDKNKSFSYYQKSANMGNVKAIYNVGYCYEKGIGVEKDIYKAFDYYQKSGCANGLNRIGICYMHGFGIEKNEKIAFEYFKKAADMGDIHGAFNVGYCYLNQMGVKMDENQVFEYFKKSADLGYALGMLYIGDCYRNGIGVSRDIQRANHWYKMYKIERDIIKSNNLLPENIDHNLKNFLCNEKYSLTWIFHNKLKNIRKIGSGGFSTVYYAYWFNESRGLWTHVAVKLFHGSNERTQEFINKLKRYCEIGFENPSFLECHGISRDDDSKDYMMILNYAKEGSLRQNLQKVAQMKWINKLNLLHCIISDLELIHSHELVHCNLHSGNILQHNLRSAYITDFKFSSEKEKEEKKIYAVLPYVAPEVLQCGKFTQASDIYSFGIIMAEISTGKSAFDGEPFDIDLAIKICQGEQPEFEIETPDFYVKLAKKCMDRNPYKRPTATTIEHYIGYWLEVMNHDDDNETRNQFLEADNFKPKIIEPMNSNEAYTSKLINTQEITEALSILSLII